MQPHITPVSSALSSMHLPQSNNYHWTLVCMSMNGRETQILVSVRSAHTNAVLIGSSRSGTRVAVQSARPLVSLPATALHPSRLSACCIHVRMQDARNPYGHRHASPFPGLGRLRGGENSGGETCEARTNVEEPLVSSQEKKEKKETQKL